MATRILVTGASGFVGSHLVDRLAAQGDVDAWTRSAWATAPEHCAVRQVELMDRSAVRDAIADRPPDVVFHCAGSPHVASSWRDSSTPLAHNVIGTHHLLDALRLTGRQCRVLLPGSATVYAPSNTQIDEGHQVKPGSPYALSKYAQERLAIRATVEDGIDVVTTRSFNHTGPRQSPEFVAPSIARQVALIEKGKVEPSLKVGNLTAKRDFTDVRDVVTAYIDLVQKGESGAIYNVASGNAVSMQQILDALLERSAVAIRVETDQARMRPHDIPFLEGNAGKLQRATGWTPAIGFNQMMDDLLDYWRQAVAGR